MPDTRQRMLDVAVEMIDDGGEAAVRVAVVCERVDVTAPVLYHHFGNRDGLVMAAQAKRFARLLDHDIAEWWSALDFAATAEEFRRGVIGGAADAFARRREVHSDRLTAMGSALSRPELLAAIMAEQDRFFVEVRKVFEIFVERGWLSPDLDLMNLIVWIYTLGQSRVMIENGSKAVDLDEWDRTAKRVVALLMFGDASLADDV